MTTTMDWEASPGGSASGSSSLNGHSETDEDTSANCRSSNLVTTLNLKLNNNNSLSTVFGDKKHNHHNNHLPTKENSLILNDGFNGLNLNPSPPVPVGQDLSISSHFSLPLPRSPINSGASKGGGQSSGSGQSSHFSSSSSSSNTTTKKHKPIPPPLDLSIGASSLNSSSSSSAIGSASFQYPGTFYSPYYLGSPKFNQAEKSLPLRKRWHSWSPKLMNSNEDLIPLYTESPSGRSTNAPGSMNGKGSSNGPEGQSAPNNSHYGGNKSNGTLQPPPYSFHGGRSGQGSSGNGNATPQSGSLQTPTPFYTPNEPSPRFMNSPVFSYSTPDTNLYQGPYSPIRTTSLYPPGSPFLNSNLNTPTFVITNLSPPTSTSSSSSAPTVGVGASSTGSNSSSTSSSSSSATPSIPTVILGNSGGFNSPFPFLSPASSQASSNQSYEEVQDLKYSNGQNISLPVAPIWNIFLPGTKVRFLSDAGQNSGYYLVDYLSQLSDLSLVLGFGLKGEYAPHGFSVKQYVVTSSARERVQITFSPINNELLRHPNIEADCEAGHPFIVLKKGISAVKPEGFTATYGSHCMKLEVLDVCVKQTMSGVTKATQPQHQHHISYPNHHHPSSSLFMSNGFSSTPISNIIRNGYGGTVTSASSNSMSRPGLSTVPSPHLALPPPQVHLPTGEDRKPSFSDIKHSFLGDGKNSWRDVEDVKPFALPLPTAMISATHHSPPLHHHSSPHHRHSPSQHPHLSSQQQHHPAPQHHQLDIQIKQEDFGSNMETEPSPPLHYDSGPKKKSKSKKKKESNNRGCSSPSGEPKGRRPMNAFLVYAKEKRPLLIQMYPGKDNRSISTLLGDSWKNLDPEEKNFYIKTAKDSADEQKKLHPDCWKRKRTQQQAQQSQSSSPIPMKMDALTRVS